MANQNLNTINVNGKNGHQSGPNGKMKAAEVRPRAPALELGLEIQDGVILLRLSGYDAALLAQACDCAMDNMIFNLNDLQAEADRALLRWMAMGLKAMAIAETDQGNMAIGDYERAETDLAEYFGSRRKAGQ